MPTRSSAADPTGLARIGRAVRQRRPTRLALAFALLVVLVGMNIVAIRLSNRELPPFWNAGARFALAAVVFGALAVARGARRPGRQALIDGSVYGLLAFAAFFGFLYLGLVRVPAGLGQVILALGPLITFAMAVAIGLERLRWRPIAGGLVALAGIALMYGVGSYAAVPLVSVLSVLAAAASFAAGGIVVKRAPAADPIVRNTIATSVGAILLLALSIVAGERWSAPTDLGTWLAFAYLVLPGTIGVFLLFLLLLRHWPATTVSTQFVLAPIIGIALGAFLLGEPVSTAMVAGAALVIAGVWLGVLRQPA
jgi:drug/metabolite transporter (DMT)-like permease